MNELSWIDFYLSDFLILFLRLFYKVGLVWSYGRRNVCCIV